MNITTRKEQFETVALLLREEDDVALTKRPIRAGTELSNASIHLIAAKDIPAGHKIALRAVADGEPVKKYGQIIGFAKGDLAPGDHVHTHNLVVKDFKRQYEYSTDLKPVQFYP